VEEKGTWNESERLIYTGFLTSFSAFGEGPGDREVLQLVKQEIQMKKQ